MIKTMLSNLKRTTNDMAWSMFPTPASEALSRWGYIKSKAAGGYILNQTSILRPLAISTCSLRCADPEVVEEIFAEAFVTVCYALMATGILMAVCILALLQIHCWERESITTREVFMDWLFYKRRQKSVLSILAHVPKEGLELEIRNMCLDFDVYHPDVLCEGKVLEGDEGDDESDEEGDDSFEWGIWEDESRIP